MSASQQTTNYNLPKFAGADKPAWLVDFNGAMDTIDTSIKTVEDLSSGLSGQITQNTSDISDLETGLGNAESLIATNTSDIATLGSTKAPITNPNFVGSVNANGLNLLLLKNAIINGGFQVNQRAKSGTVILNAGEYGHDRWKAGSSGCTYTFNTVENLTTITITAGSLIQVIEGLNLETDTYTLAWEGNAQGKIGAGAYGVSGITGAVIGGTNLSIEFGVGTVAKVRFNRGATPIIWQIEPYDEVLRKCQRYYQRMTRISDGIVVNQFAFSYNSTGMKLLLPAIVPFRIPPTIVEYQNIRLWQVSDGIYSISSLTLDYSDVHYAEMTILSSGLNAFRNYFIVWVSGTAYLALSAEL